MRISMVTLSFNQGRFLERALRSVLDQGYPDLNYIVVDPGSSDQSREIIEQYRPRIDKVLDDPDQGPADGLNRGFAAADGTIFGFLNADDVLAPGALREVAAAFQRHRGADVVAGHGWLIDEAGARIRRKYSYPFTAWRYLYQGAYLLQQSTFFRASAYRTVKGFNVENRSCWDGEFWLDLALAGQRFQIVDAFWSGFRVYDQSITGAAARKGALRDLYHQDRQRMFTKATGRLPAGPSYWSRRAVAQILKWAGKPEALWYRLGALMDARSRQAPI